MIKLRYPEQHTEDYPEDISRIVRVLGEQGYEVSRRDAERAWQEYSNGMAAGWMTLPRQDSIVASIALTYLEEVEE